MAKTLVRVSEEFGYRFICEHCGTQTDWLRAEISDSIFSEGTPDKKKEFQESFYEKTYPDKKDKILNGKYNKAEKMNGKCPKCGKRQSWESVTTNIGLFIVGFAGCLIGSLICLGALLEGTTSAPDYRVLLIGIVCLIGTFVCLFLSIGEIAKKIKVHADSSKTTNRNKPEIEFFERKKEENVQLTTPAMIKVVRESSFGGAMHPCRVYLNSEFIDNIKNGKTLEIPTSVSHNIVIVSDHEGNLFKGDFVADLEAGGYVEVHIKNGKFVKQ